MKINSRKFALYVTFMIAGVAAMLVSLLLNGNVAKEITGVCVGIGAGLFGMYSSKLITMCVEVKSPEAVRVKNIAVNDERNTLIRE